MKLIIREYLRSLRERGELDVIVPDLLSQLGLNVFSRPGRGTRQDGVDVAAVGSLDGGPDKVYLFSIKPGDLTRKAWDGDPIQSLRPSLNEILDAYIPNRLPAEHRGKEIVICLSIGGDFQEQVRSQLTGFEGKYQTEKITFQEWNGDKFASLIQENFLREDLLPKGAQSHLRKSLALLDEPHTSYQHFLSLLSALSAVKGHSDAERTRAIRQMSICLWILFAWARESGNLESPYLSSELAVLHAWNIISPTLEEKTTTQRALETTFFSIFSTYRLICAEFLEANVLAHVDEFHALSSGIRGSCGLDINLKLFDLVSRVGIDGIWAYWNAQHPSTDSLEHQELFLKAAWERGLAIKAMISNNPALLLPIRDNDAIDISIALLLLTADPKNWDDVKKWLSEISARAKFAHIAHSNYPCILKSYADLLAHPKRGDDKYRENVTSGSILYPLTALMAAILGDEETYNMISDLKRDELTHCNFQLWYPDDQSEKHIYINSDSHGATLSDVCVEKSRADLQAQVFGECDRSPHFRELSAVKSGWWPLVIVACRHYRLPLPTHIFQDLHKSIIGDDSPAV